MKTHTDSCIEHTLSVLNSGYGQVARNGKKWLAHRLAWFEAHGEIPAGMQVCHACDNRLCINIDHLFLGTNQDNVTDMMKKRRHRHGETHHNATLSDAVVDFIRASKRDALELSKIFSVHRSTIYKIRNHRVRVNG